MESLQPVNLYFILKHKVTNEEIVMPVLSICEEFSHIAFSTKNKDYKGKYNGIGRLPTYKNGNDTSKDYIVFVVINGIRHLYSGLLYSPDEKLLKDAVYDGNGSFYGSEWEEKY
jgi:hypothetical protein